MADNDIALKPKTRVKPKLDKPKLYKVILVNDDYTPREFVTVVLKVVFRMSEEAGYRVMMTAHKLGSCVVVVCTKILRRRRPRKPSTLPRRWAFH